jgi:hypothetical protein
MLDALPWPKIASNPSPAASADSGTACLIDQPTCLLAVGKEAGDHLRMLQDDCVDRQQVAGLPGAAGARPG